MVKLVVAYRHPTDTEEFERRYQGEHVEVARRIPHLARIEFGKVACLMDGSPAPYHRIAEPYFADEATLGQAGGSEEGKAAFAHAGEIATGGSTPWSSRLKRARPDTGPTCLPVRWRRNGASINPSAVH